jgi:hypothetical protein
MSGIDKQVFEPFYGKPNKPGWQNQNEATHPVASFFGYSHYS